MRSDAANPLVSSISKATVLFISHDASRTGAPLCLSELLARIGADDALISPLVYVTGDGPLISEWRGRGLTVVASRKRVRGSVIKRLSVLLKSLTAYVRLLHEVRPKLVYSNTIRNGLEVILARLMRIRTIVHVHEGEQIMRQYSRSFRISSWFVSEFICVSEYCAKSLRRTVGRTCAVVHNGIESGNAVNSVVARPVATPKVLGIVGGIQPNKGQRVAVEALGILASKFGLQLRLRMIGEVEDSAYRQVLEGLIAVQSLSESIEFMGSIADRATIYASFDALLLPSFDESFPRVLLEAFAHSRPVIATCVGGVPEIVRDEENGLLIPPGDSRKLAEAISRMAAHPELCGRLVANARRDVVERFRLEETTRKLRECILHALRSSAQA